MELTNDVYQNLVLINLHWPRPAYWGVLDCDVVGRSVIKYTKYYKYNVQSVLVFSQVEIVS